MHGFAKLFCRKDGRNEDSLFALLKKPDKFEWTQEARMRSSRSSTTCQTPVLVAPQLDKEFFYISLPCLIRESVIVIEKERVQYPVYYVSEALQDANTR